MSRMFRTTCLEDLQLALTLVGIEDVSFALRRQLHPPHGKPCERLIGDNDAKRPEPSELAVERCICAQAPSFTSRCVSMEKVRISPPRSCPRGRRDSGTRTPAARRRRLR